MRGLVAAISLLAVAAVSASPLEERHCGGGSPCSSPPNPPPPPPPCHNCCLTSTIARGLAETWNYFWVNIDPALALATLTEDFVYFSDSDNIISETPFVRVVRQ